MRPFADCPPVKMPEVYVNYGDVPADVQSFTCDEPALDSFLKTRAASFIQKGLCAVTLLLDSDTREVLGFYAISPYAIDGAALREEQQKHFDVTFEIPAWKIGELAVHAKYQRNPKTGDSRRYGTMLLQEAIEDIQRRAARGAGALIMVDTINRKVKKFYKKFGFASLPNVSNQMARPVDESTAQ